LRGHESRLAITYLTDLRLAELVSRVQNLPEKSIILYVWQQLANQNDLVESPAILGAVAHAARVPIYGVTSSTIGRGVVGGYVVTTEGNATKLAELTLRIAGGIRAADIAVESAPVVPMFDWRQLRRWDIREDLLPPVSIVRFREPTMWQQYKWRIVAAIVLFILQGSLIAALLVERQRARRTQRELREYKGQLEDLVEKRTAELVQARDLALAANRSKSMFLAHMSHELRTPLNAILGFSEMVLKDDGLPPKHRQDLTIVANSGEHLLGLIDEVLDMAKIETGRNVAEIARFDLHRLLSETAEMLRERAQAKNLVLLLEISPRCPQFVQSDSRRLRQILINLVGNAVKYTDQGRVVLRSDARRSENSANLTLTFDVEDTGIGIAPEDEARIFEPFVQAENAGGRKGTGLGLSISRHFVHLLGGKIELQSSPGQGSRFHLEIPAQIAEAEEIATDTEDVQVIGLQAGQQRYRILIVEDQTENWLLLQRKLEAVGFEVRVAEDGVQAIAAFSAWHPHFIWMDIRLPVLNGMEATKRIRMLDGGRDVKIVAVTASAFASQREDVIAAGFDDFLRKPYRSREIFGCMARHLCVEFRYGSPGREDDGERPATLDADEVAALPPALQEQLKTAVIFLDPGRVASAIAEVSKQNARLGDDLTRLAGQFSYTPILHALQTGRTRERKPDDQPRRSGQDQPEAIPSGNPDPARR
jgi:signal transduction histidine kinase/CheY-like chemotaxis protein